MSDLRPQHGAPARAPGPKPPHHRTGDRRRRTQGNAMNRHARLAALAALLAAAQLAPTAARADRRYYAETYNAVTAAPGGLDVELWSTLNQRKAGSDDPSYWRHQLELETGLTERWDVALYNDFRYDFGGSTRYEALRLESRYRLSQPGEWFVDPVLYLEVKKEFIDDKPWAVEEKLILGKDLGRLNLSLNLVAEQEFLPGGDREYEYGWALGASVELTPAIRLGGEAWGAWTNVRVGGGDLWEKTAYAGPAASVAWSRYWLTAGAGWGITDQSNRLQARAIFAVQL